MDSQSAATQSHSTILSTSIRDEIVDFDNLRENVTGKLSLENWMVLPSHRSLHIFSLNKMLNGNLSIRNTIFINVDLVVKVFGEESDETLFSLKLSSWPQLQTLIEQCGAQVKREVDLEFIDVVDKTANSETSNSCEIVHQPKDTLVVEFSGINIKPELSEEMSTVIHQPLTELIENSISQMKALGYNNTFVSQNSFSHAALLIHPKDGDQSDEPLVHKTSEIGTHQSQICSICKEQIGIGEMDRHLQQHFNGDSYQCSVCGREYRSFVGLQKHMKSHHVTAGDEFFCDICKVSRNFETKANIEEHMKDKHCGAPKKQPVMNCSTCNKEFFTRKQFTAHMRRHDRSKWKSCPICHKTYDNVKRHMNGKHFNIKNHICDICGSAFKQWTSLKEHIESRHTSQEFFCEICQNGKGFRSKEYLKRHFAKVHNKGHTKVPAKVYPRKYISKPLLPFYECNSCHEKLPTRYALRKHVALRHRHNVQFSCNMCDKRFALKSSLAVHAKLHAGKLHICHECGQSFNHENYLTKHLARHKNKKRKCTMCEKEYVQNVDLRLHMNKVHGVTSPVGKSTEQL
ncbi:zinc finger protein 287-like [Bradysia coprophila]|uniref:zinc finger protein 287-like n=1 Tax=Bradysia coprophila TaxID=38358 RepID=UPI00187DC779|nr:zinc finger protein 287-like [Bradysia coprophila]